MCVTAADCYLGGTSSNNIIPHGFLAANQGRCRQAVSPADRRCIAIGKLNLLPNGCTEDQGCPSESGICGTAHAQSYVR